MRWGGVGGGVSTRTGLGGSGVSDWSEGVRSQ